MIPIDENTTLGKLSDALRELGNPFVTWSYRDGRNFIVLQKEGRIALQSGATVHEVLTLAILEYRVLVQREQTS